MPENNLKPESISHVMAEALLDKYNDLNDLIEKKPMIDPPIPKELSELIKNKNNAFIFDKESFQSLISRGADHIAIVLGAHNIDHSERQIKAGSFTVMAIGYKKDNNHKGKGNKYDIIKTGEPAFEYPPKHALTQVAHIEIGEDNKRIINDPVVDNPDELVIEKITGSLFTF